MRKRQPNWKKTCGRAPKGLKIYKSLGMYIFYEDSTRVRTDDPNLDPIWQKAGELGIPSSSIRRSGPFWEPHDRLNERWFELKERPRRKREPVPFWETIMGEHWNLIARHPGTIFISAHMGWLGQRPRAAGRSAGQNAQHVHRTRAVIGELGRQPHTASAFLTKYQDRVLMGKDSWAPDEYHVYFRIFETADEYFPYYRKRHAFWSM